MKTTLLYQHSIVLAGAPLTVCDGTLLALYRSSARSGRRYRGSVVVWRPALGFVFAKHFKTRVVLVCGFVVPASGEDVAFGHLTLTHMLAVPPPALASRLGLEVADGFMIMTGALEGLRCAAVAPRKPDLVP